MAVTQPQYSVYSPIQLREYYKVIFWRGDDIRLTWDLSSVYPDAPLAQVQGEESLGAMLDRVTQYETASFFERWRLRLFTSIEVDQLKLGLAGRMLEEDLLKNDDIPLSLLVRLRHFTARLSNAPSNRSPVLGRVYSLITCEKQTLWGGLVTWLKLKFSRKRAYTEQVEAKASEVKRDLHLVYADATQGLFERYVQEGMGKPDSAASLIQKAENEVRALAPGLRSGFSRDYVWEPASEAITPEDVKQGIEGLNSEFDEIEKVGKEKLNQMKEHLTVFEKIQTNLAKIERAAQKDLKGIMKDKTFLPVQLERLAQLQSKAKTEFARELRLTPAAQSLQFAGSLFPEAQQRLVDEFAQRLDQRVAAAVETLRKRAQLPEDQHQTHKTLYGGYLGLLAKRMSLLNVTDARTLMEEKASCEAEIAAFEVTCDSCNSAFNQRYLNVCRPVWEERLAQTARAVESWEAIVLEQDRVKEALAEIKEIERISGVPETAGRYEHLIRAHAQDLRRRVSGYEGQYELLTLMDKSENLIRILDDLVAEIEKHTLADELSRVMTTILQEKIAADDFVLFERAAENGDLSVLSYLAEKAPDKLQKMIAEGNFRAFRWAARNGHLPFLSFLAEKAPDKLQEMIAAYDFEAFKKAARNGNLPVLRFLAEKAPDKLQEMIAAYGFYAFRRAAHNGDFSVLSFLAEKAPDKLQKMIAKNRFHMFERAAKDGDLPLLSFLAEKTPGRHLQMMMDCCGLYAFQRAAENGHLSVLCFLVEKASGKLLQEMIAANGFEAFKMAARNGHLPLLSLLAEKAPDKLQEMIAVNRFAAFQSAAANGHLPVLRFLAEKAPGKLYEMITANCFDAFLEAARNGHLPVLRYLEQKVLGKLTERFYARERGMRDRLLQKMIAAGNFGAFLGAAENGHLPVLSYLEQKVPGKLQEMIAENSFAAFREAARNGHLLVLSYLDQKAPGKLQEMIAAHDFAAFQVAAGNGHLPVLSYLEQKAPGRLQEMIASHNFRGIDIALQDRHDAAINHLLTYAYTYDYAERHFNEHHYQAPVTDHTNFFLSKLATDITAFQNNQPNGVFDFASDDAATDAHRALYGYYVLRHLIRQLDNNRFGDDVYTHITRLLEIPSVKALLLLNTTVTRLPQGHVLGVFDFAQQPNELLRLAVNAGDQRVIQRLLAIPAVRAQAAQSNFYQGAAGLDLHALARDRESSMTGLTPQEQQQVQGIENAYQEAIKGVQGGVLGVIEALRQDLMDTFLAPEHVAERQLTLRGGALPLTLPFEYEAFQALIHEHKLNPAEINAVNQVYYQNTGHTAWRYLAKPNRWMDKNASFVYLNDAHTERWSTFEEYQPFIAYLYTAAKDEKHPSIEQNTSIQDRVALFMRALALINRQHNWDKYRVKRNKENEPLLDSSKEPIKEQYDDGRGDCPSCFSGVKRNLFQSLIGHPLYTPLDDNIMRQFIREEIRAHYVEILNDYSPEELIAIKEDTEDCIFDVEAEQTPRLKNLCWQGEKIIQEKMEKTFKERGVPYYSLIPDTLYPGKKENTFIGYYNFLGLDQLIDKLINAGAEALKGEQVDQKAGAQVLSLPSAVSTEKKPPIAERDATPEVTATSSPGAHSSRFFATVPDPLSEGFEGGAYTNGTDEEDAHFVSPLDL